METPAEIEKLMGLTDPKLLGLVFDTGHYRFGGGDPLEGLRKHRERVWHFHFKDYNPEVGRQSAEEGWDYFEVGAAAAFSASWARVRLISRRW